jgi:succinoglycan biosynthesis protein ExoA
MSEPILTAVVPCRNECRHIETCLRSILAQEPPGGSFEIIVADGMSDDGTREILQRLAQEDSRLRVVDNPGRTTPRAMNTGIRAARGSIVAIMGAHNRYAPDYLRRSVETLERTGADNVGGAMICEAETFLQEAIAAAHHSPFSAGGARWHDPEYEGPADTVFAGVYRREVFDRIGLFDEELTRNQDDELNLRLTRSGGKIWQSPSIRSWYRPRASLGALFRQYKQYGYWKVRVIQKHKLPASIRHVVPAGFVLALALLPLLGLAWKPALWAWFGLLGAYLAGNLGASLLTAARSGWKLFPVLPAVFVCYHVAYGYGFLLGIRDFVVLRRAPAASFTKLTRTPGD